MTHEAPMKGRVEPRHTILLIRTCLLLFCLFSLLPVALDRMDIMPGFHIHDHPGLHTMALLLHFFCPLYVVIASLHLIVMMVRRPVPRADRIRYIGIGTGVLLFVTLSSPLWWAMGYWLADS